MDANIPDNPYGLPFTSDSISLEDSQLWMMHSLLQPSVPALSRWWTRISLRVQRNFFNVWLYRTFHTITDLGLCDEASRHGQPWFRWSRHMHPHRMSSNRTMKQHISIIGYPGVIFFLPFRLWISKISTSIHGPPPPEAGCNRLCQSVTSPLT